MAPELIDVETVPITVRVIGEGKFKELVEAVVSLVTDPEKRTKLAVKETLSQEEWGKALQACRNGAKRAQRRIAAVYRDGALHIKDAGEFKGMDPAVAAERDKKRKETLAKKAEDAKKAGKPSPAKEAAAGRSR